MKELPFAARLYVAATLAAGATLLALFGFRALLTLPSVALFVVLLLFSSLASAMKVNLPLTTSGSTMSVSYAVDFAALLLLGADATMIVAAVSAWSQCTFRTQIKSPAHRTLFSMAALVLTVKTTGIVYSSLGGPSPGTMFSWDVAKPLVGAAIAYFVCNTTLIATAISLSAHQPTLRVWN